MPEQSILYEVSQQDKNLIDAKRPGFGMQYPLTFMFDISDA